MTHADIYLGRPGNLVAIPHPRNGIVRTRVRPRATFATASGGARVSQLPGGKRLFTLTWGQLWYETYATLEAIDQGHEGIGPFVLIDPATVNLLTVNQSAVTGELNSTDNFTLAGTGSSLATDSATVDRGPRSLRWDFTSTGGTLNLDSPSPDWSGFPVVAGKAHRFWFTARGAGTDAIMTMTPSIVWLDTAGATISTTTGSGVASASGSFGAIPYVGGTAPATAAYATLRVVVTAASSGSILYVGRAQFDHGSGQPVASDWRPGGAVCPVAPVSLSDEWPWEAHDYRRNPIMVLQEVGS